MTFQLLKICSLTLSGWRYTIWTLRLLPSARLTPYPSRRFNNRTTCDNGDTTIYSCREDFRTERTWLHYTYFVQRQLLVSFLFFILFIFDVAFCQLVFLHEYMIWYDDIVEVANAASRRGCRRSAFHRHLPNLCCYLAAGQPFSVYLFSSVFREPLNVHCWSTIDTNYWMLVALKML